MIAGEWAALLRLTVQNRNLMKRTDVTSGWVTCLRMI